MGVSTTVDDTHLLKKAEELSRLGSFKLKISFLRRRDLLRRYVKCRQLSREQSCHSSLLRLPRSRLWSGAKFSRYRLKHLLVTHARRPDNDRPTRSSRILAPLRMDGDAHSSSTAWPIDWRTTSGSLAPSPRQTCSSVNRSSKRSPPRPFYLPPREDCPPVQVAEPTTRLCPA